MSAAFTAITAGSDLQDLDMINEIVKAYSERRQAIGQSAIDLLEEADDVQVYSLFHEIQDWLENYCPVFVNDGVAIEGAAEVTLFDLASWRVAAGLNEDGFSRATVWEPDPTSPDWTVDPEFEYGNIVAGDILFAPWIFDELQRGLSALKWTSEPAAPADWWQNQGGANGTSSCTDVRNAAIANWDADAGSSGGGGNIYLVVALGYQSAGPTWHFGGTRIKIQSKLTAYTFRPSSCSVYGLGEAYMAVPFQDIDGLGITDGCLHLLETISESSDAARHTATIANTTTAPFVAAGVTCPVGTSWDGTGAQIREIHWIMKWNFTNA